MQPSSIPIYIKTSSGSDATTVNSCDTDIALIEIHLSVIHLYVQSEPQKPKAFCMAGLIIYFASFVMMEFQFSRLLIVTENIYMGAQADKYSGSGKLKVWLKSKLYQLTTPQDLIYVVHYSKVYLFLS